MSSPLVIVLVVALTNGGEDAASPLARTVQESLGAEAIVLTREEPSPDDSRMARLGDELHADVVVVVTWGQDALHRQARLHFYASRSRTWTDRDVAFSAEDPPDERGRALGYGIASMVRVRFPTSAGVEVAPPEQRDEPSTTPPTVTHPLADARAASRFHAEARVQGAVALGDAGGSLGGEGALGVRLSTPFALRLFGGLRAGDLPAARASSTYARVGGGVVWTMLELDGRLPVGFSTRLDLLALRQTASRVDGESSGGRWVTAGAFVLEAAWSLHPRAAVVTGAGVETAFESTHVFVDGREAATIAPVRLLGEVGVRVGID